MALVLEVLVNGERFTVAGEESLCVLSAHVTASGKLGSESRAVRNSTQNRADISLSISGLTSRGRGERDEHMNWGPRLSLRLGDEVRITVRDDDNYERASRRTPVQDYSSPSLSARKRFLDARSIYFRWRDRYGTWAEKKDRQRRGRGSPRARG